MSAKWEHPDLGTFEFEDHPGWTKVVELPAFAVFVYDTGDRTASPPGTQEMAFQAEDETDLPSQAAIALARKVLTNQTTLASAVAAALWDDFNGNGSDSGMWWHGDLRNVIEWGTGAQERLQDALPWVTADLPPLTGPDALRHWMRLSQVWVRKEVRRGKGPLIELSFHAAFEPEHGVGVLTDGEAIVGTGYDYDVTPFES